MLLVCTYVADCFSQITKWDYNTWRAFLEYVYCGNYFFEDSVLRGLISIAETYGMLELYEVCHMLLAGQEAKKEEKEEEKDKEGGEKTWETVVTDYRGRVIDLEFFPPSTVHHDMAYALRQSIASDVTFVVKKEREIHAHSIFLKRNPQFVAAFLQGEAQGPRVIHMPDMHADVLMDYLNYLYTDTIKRDLHPSTRQQMSWKPKRDSRVPFCLVLLSESCEGSHCLCKRYHRLRCRNCLSPPQI